MRITAIQMNSGTDKTKNLETAKRLCSKAVAKDHPDLIVLPEMVSHLGGSVGERQGAAEGIPGGESFRMLREVAREHRVFVHGGSYYESAPDSNLVFNTTVAFDRFGELLATYRKIHLFDIVAPDGTEYRESAVVGRGNDVVSYSASGVKVGCTICYDLRFGELYRMLAERGVELITVPAAFTLQTGKDHWEVLLRARAIETQAYVVAAAQWGSFPVPDGIQHTWGHSMIVDPWGQIVAQASDGTGFATAEMDLDYLTTVRRRIPMLDHRVLPG